MSTPSRTGPLRSIRVLDLCREYAGRYCGRLLADAGALVVTPMRPGKSTVERYVSFSKTILCSGGQEPEQSSLLDFVLSADIVLDDFNGGRPLHSAFGDLERLNPGAVHVTVSPFGREGEYSGYSAQPALAEALSGLTYERGDRRHPPLHLTTHAPDFCAGASAFAATLIALHSARATGAGQRVDVAAIETLVLMNEALGVLYPWLGSAPTRAWDQSMYLLGTMRCRDGWIMAYIPGPTNWELFTIVLAERPDLFEDERFSTLDQRIRNAQLLREELQSWFASWAVEELFDRAQELRLPFGRFLSPHSLTEDEQSVKRSAFVEVEGTPVPSAPARFSRSGMSPRPAVEYELERGTLAAWSERGPSDVGPSAQPNAGAQLDGPLTGLRVVDLSIFWAGPSCTRVLADFGAEVVRVESTKRPDPMRVVLLAGNDITDRPWERGWAALVNRNKRSIALDVTTPRGKELLIELIHGADVLVENFSPRVLRNWGLTYKELSRDNPRLVMISLSGYGQDGPLRDAVAFGIALEAESGAGSCNRYPDEERPYVLDSTTSDPIAGVFGAGMVLLALAEREASGLGQYIDLSEREAVACLIGDRFLDEEAPETDACAVLRCSGADEWVLVDVASATVEALKALGVRSEDPARTSLTAFVATREKKQAMRELQAAGISAAAVLHADEVWLDPHLRDRRTFTMVEHPVIGRHPVTGPLAQLSKSPGRIRTAAPTLGEHSREVLASLCNLSDAEIDRLIETGLVGTEPTPPIRVAAFQVQTLVEAGAILPADPHFRERLERTIRESAP